MAKKTKGKKGGNAKKKTPARKPPSETESPPLSQVPTTTSKPVCKFLLDGRCKRGDDCKFLHTPQAAAMGARAQAIRDGKSAEEQDRAASIALQVAQRKLELKEAEANESKEKGAADSDIQMTETKSEGDQSPNVEVEANNWSSLQTSEDTRVIPKKTNGKSSSTDAESAVIDTEKESTVKEEKKKTSLPPGLQTSLSLFSPSQQELAKKLCELPGSTNQCHLFENWTNDSAFVEKKKTMMAKLESIDQSYPAGGLVGYLKNAVELLDKSRRGVNPLEGWVPSVPKGEAFEVGTDAFLSTEKLGLQEVGACGFVLVAGGLGERLGYSGIKIGLPTELSTETIYIQFYIETILAFQSRYAKPGQKLPLCIMTSGDTNNKTVDLLSKHNYFGMEKDQITIVQQGKGVPALYDNDAHIALNSNDPYDIQMKPHGHGDIHALLHSHGVAKSWLEKGVKWTVFFQDTNGLAFHTLALSLGVSSKMGLIMNSITCPRKAKQAIGAITKLTKGDQQRTINVEYNQLDPLLRATGYPDGDVNDETGFSPFPGNINQLLFRLEDYVKVLERTKGVMPEFVNPKYKDTEKTIFKKPTRLECMMQDFPIVLVGSEVEKVGFTSLASEQCFSPVKNATADGVALQKNGTHPGVAATGEADQSSAMRRILRSIGCDIEEGSKVVFSDIEVISGPDCVLKPNFATCANELKSKFPNPSSVKISGRSSLVLSGDGLVIEGLNLNGALIVECEDGASGVIRNLSVQNKGWVKVSDGLSKNEVIRMRGYHISKLETETIVFKKDGNIEGNYSPDAKASPVEDISRASDNTSPNQSSDTGIKAAKSLAKDPTSHAITTKLTKAPEETPVKTGLNAAETAQPQQKGDAGTSKVASVKTDAENITPKLPAPQAQPHVEVKDEVKDLSKPGNDEAKEPDTFCGGACIIL